MATAKKLPSGSWRCLVFSHYENVVDKDGKPVIDPKTKKQKQKRIYKSFTCDDPSARGKRKVEAMAAEWADNKEIKKDEEVQISTEYKKFQTLLLYILHNDMFDCFSCFRIC